jgi:hypothetical protein
LAFDLDGSRRWLIWFGADPDGVVCADGKVVSFRSVEGLRAYANERGLDLDDSDAVFNLDRALEWDSDPDVVEAMNCWNLATDVASSLDEPFDDRSPAKMDLYDKVFRALNLPAMTRPGERYVPRWSPAELALLRAVLTEGIALVRAALVDDAG